MRRGSHALWCPAQDLKAVSCESDEDLQRWWAGVRLAVHGPQLRANWEATGRKFDLLVRMGHAQESVVRPVGHGRQAFDPDSERVRQWHARRAARPASV